MDSIRTPGFYKAGFWLAGGVLLTLLAYTPSFQGSFHSDDYIVIQFNPDIQNPSHYWTLPPQYRQFLLWSYAVNYLWSGLETWSFHLTNLVLHGVSGLLVGLLLFKTASIHNIWNREMAAFAGSLATLLFLLHPVHTEAITYISGRSSALSTCLVLLSLWAFLSAWQRESKPLKTFTCCLLSLTATALAVLSKETTLVLPALLVAYDLCFMNGTGWKSRKSRVTLFYFPLVVLALGTLVATPTLLGVFNEWMAKTDWGRLLLQGPVLLYGLSRLLFPFNLTFDTDFKPAFLHSAWQPLSYLFLIGLLYFFLRKEQSRFPLAGFAVLWFGFSLLPTNSILPRLDWLSERNLYLPSVALCWLMAGSVVSLIAKQPETRQKKLVFLLAGSFLMFSLLTADRNTTYKSDVSLWRDTLTKSPEKSEVRYYLALSYHRAGKTEKAREEFEMIRLQDPQLAERLQVSSSERESIENSTVALLDHLLKLAQADPGQNKLYAHVYRELTALSTGTAHLYYSRLLVGAQQAEQGQIQKAEAQFQQAVKARPHLPDAYLSLGILFARQQKWESARKALAQAEARMDLNMELKHEILWLQGQLAYDQKLWEDARHRTEHFLEEGGQKPRGYLLLGKIAQARGDNGQAVTYLEKVQGRNPEAAEAQFLLGMLHVGSNQPRKALAAFDKAVRLDPDFDAARFNLARLLLDQSGNSDLVRKHLKYLQQRPLTSEQHQSVEQLFSMTKSQP